MNVSRLSALSIALAVTGWFALSTSASAEIASCVSCHQAGLAEAGYLPLAQWNLPTGLLRAMNVPLPNFVETPLQLAARVPEVESPLSFEQAPLMPSRHQVNWDGGELPGALQRPWSLSRSDYNPAFITSFYNSNEGFTANPFTTRVSPALLSGPWGVAL